MIYPPDFEERVGFDQLRNRLMTYCISEPGKRQIEKICFSDQYQEITRCLHENYEALQLLQSGKMYATDFFINDQPLVEIISRKGTYLDPGDLLRLARLLESLLRTRKFFLTHNQEYPFLADRASQAEFNASIPAIILQIVGEEGTVRDSASVELALIRKRLNEARALLRDTVQRVFLYALKEGWVPEGAQPTLRNGRLTIPVLTTYKRRVKGFIQDESATGQTTYIEPVQALETGNQIRELELAQQREEIRILTALTDTLRNYLPDLLRAITWMVHLDVLRAKALLAAELRATLPMVHDRPCLKWMEARHPLLVLQARENRSVVPLHTELTDVHRMLLISGPNAGGKSVCLKTVGLLQYMVQCGLMVPASPDSEFGIFTDLFADIGDQQSIENDLSTYSSHLKNMSFFIRHASHRALVLMDELGSGTDPNFGGAIAQAVLHTLLNAGVWGVATTHYYNLKVFAAQAPGIRNGAMRFDEHTLQPLFRLDIGKPGSSFALEIARKTGLPEEVLQQASLIAGKDLMDVDRLLRQLQQDRTRLEQLIEENTKLNQIMRQQREQLQEEAAFLHSRRENILQEARQQALHIIEEANREIEKTIRYIRANQAQRSETRKVRQQLQQMAEKLAVQESDKSAGNQHPLLLQTGDIVRMKGYEGTGEVISVDGNTVTVRFGDLKTRIHISRLEKADHHRPVKREEVSNVVRTVQEKQAQFSGLLDVRGKRVEEVLPLLEQFMDTAVMLGHAEVRILHGKGEGVLRKVIRDRLKTYHGVVSIADAHADKGGAGITVVVLK